LDIFQDVPRFVRDGCETRGLVRRTRCQTQGSWEGTWAVRGMLRGVPYATSSPAVHRLPTRPDRLGLVWHLVEPIGFVRRRRMLGGMQCRVEAPTPRHWVHGMINA